MATITVKDGTMDESLNLVVNCRPSLSNLVKRPMVNIEWQDLKYTAHSTSGNSHDILNGVSGRFLSGELSCIIGPSGAGKTTLMNVLVGYITTGVSGSVYTNDHPRQLRLFHKLSSYIMQDDLLQPRITVKEAMTIAAELKLGKEMTHVEKKMAVEEVLETLGLTVCKDTFTERLSGGQRKRLAVGLELVNNPPVIFLDEPTSGLDIVSMKHLLDVLQLLSRQGRTIVCTIHQPSASLFQQFDHVYALCEGTCLYQGAPGQLVEFLTSCEMHCPKHYNPADFALECMHGDQMKTMSSAIMNGKLSKSAPGPPAHVSSQRRTAGFSEEALGRTCALAEMEFPTSSWTQFEVLLKRMFLQTWRNKVALWIQLLHATLCSIFVGLIFQDIGDDGTRPFENFKFCISVLVYFFYTHIMVPILVYPTELQIMKREFFNRWYGLKSYYFALTVSTLPIQWMNGMIFVTISYVMSGQPLTLDRFILFSVTGLLTGMCSEGYGLFIGTVFNCTNGAVVGPFSAAPFLVLSVYGMGYGNVIEPLYDYLMKLSYLRFGLVGFSLSLYSYNRPLMQCEDPDVMYCHYRDPKMLLRDLGMENLSHYSQLLCLVGYILLFRLAAFLALRFRLTVEFSNRLLNYLRKILRHKGY